DGIRDDLVTGVQTCALPIFEGARVLGDDENAAPLPFDRGDDAGAFESRLQISEHPPDEAGADLVRLRGQVRGEAQKDFHEVFSRSEERRVGKACRCWLCGWE